MVWSNPGFSDSPRDHCQPRFAGQQENTVPDSHEWGIELVEDFPPRSVDIVYLLPVEKGMNQVGVAVGKLLMSQFRQLLPVWQGLAHVFSKAVCDVDPET